MNNKLLTTLALTGLLTLNTSAIAKEQIAVEKQTVETPVGTFEYIGGYPTKESVKKAFDQLDMQRAAQVYLEFMPAMSVQSIFNSHLINSDAKLSKAGDIGVYIYPGKGKSEAIGLTYNTESVYATSHTNLKQDGPTVIEVPPDVLGVVDDGWQRYVTDLGAVGPDKGKGGKYLLLPPDYDGEVPEGYYAFKCPTYKNWVMVRGSYKMTGVGEDALKYYKEHFKVYPLKTGPKDDTKYYSLSFLKDKTTHPRDITYFYKLNDMVQFEPLSAFTPYELGLLKSIGIEKGKPFAPDKRMKKILTEGVKLGDAIAKANAYASRLDNVRIYPDRKYETFFVGGRYDFILDKALLLDARTLFHYEAIVITPAMAQEMIGKGSQYLTCYRDADDNYLMGDQYYKLTLPKGIPVNNFWSVTAYNPETRSLLQNDQEKPSVSSFDKPDVNTDGSVDIYFGPEAPKGKEKNWIRTVPDKGWSIFLRLYGPLKPYFDKTWKPDDIRKVDNNYNQAK